MTAMRSSTGWQIETSYGQALAKSAIYASGDIEHEEPDSRDAGQIEFG